jgi:hypothetical protein
MSFESDGQEDIDEENFQDALDYMSRSMIPSGSSE